ncbi:MAG: polyprenol monophosphomannose synthase, partial [Planctomycetaceae bacterium]|nr:polyprenol monophosphomannose synthase [Planctomycetaceae bacterium]
MSSLLVTLCTYNERENIELLIPEILQLLPDAVVLVIDDHSPDGTGKLADEMAAADTRIRTLHRSGKLGLGTAIVRGLRYAIEHQFEFVVNLDADFSHNPKYIPGMVACMDRCDVSIASRYMPGGGVAGWTASRRLMSRLINLWARLMLGLSTADNSGSFRCFRVSRLRRIDWSRILARGYAFQEEILYRCRRAGCRFEEYPIIFEDRRFGQTKISLNECLSAVWVIFRLGIQRALRRPVLLPEDSTEPRPA